MKRRLFTILTVGSLVLCLAIYLFRVRGWAFDEYVAWMTAKSAFARPSQDGAVILLAMPIAWGIQRLLQSRRPIAAIFAQLLSHAMNAATAISSNTGTLMKHRLFLMVWTPLSIMSLLVCSLTAILWVREDKAPSRYDFLSPNHMKLEIVIDRAYIYGSSFRSPGHCSRDALVIAWYRPFPSQVVGPTFRTSFGPEDAIQHPMIYDTKESVDFRKTWAMKDVNRDAGILGFRRFYPMGWNWEGTSHNVHESMYGVCDEVVIPLWFIKLMALILPFSVAILIHRALKRRRLQRAGRCSVCGYDLRASPARCPECGNIRVAIAVTMNDEAMDLLLERESGNRPIACSATLSVPSPGTPGEG